MMTGGGGDDDDNDDDEYTNLCLYNLCFLLFLFIYSSLSIIFSFLPYLTIPLLESTGSMMIRDSIALKISSARNAATITTLWALLVGGKEYNAAVYGRYRTIEIKADNHKIFIPAVQAIQYPLSLSEVDEGAISCCTLI